jgi:hypothetical protein
MPPQSSIEPDTANITIVDEDCKYFTTCLHVIIILCLVPRLLD